MKLHFYLSIITAIILTGCATPTPIYVTATAAPTATPKPLLEEGGITFKRYDGKEYSGTVYGQGETAIILANMGQGGASQWDYFVKAVDKQKFTVISFNYSRPDFSAAEQEVEIILDTLKGVGYKRVVCMGASLGVSACAYIARAPEIVGIVLIAGENAGGPIDGPYPKLFIAGRLDRFSTPIEGEYKKAPDPKALIIYPDTASHGTDLFYSPVGDQFLKSLLDFVNAIP